MASKPLAGKVATVFNGSGFVAQNLLSRLGKLGAQMVVAYRGSIYSEEKTRISGGLGQMYYSHYHLKDEKSLHEAMKYSNIVVNCIGKEQETRNFSFEEVHVEGPRRMARLAREAGVEKFVHLSYINAKPNPKPFYLKNGSNFCKTKYYGELAVKEEFPDAVIVRPSDVVGERDNFINHYTSFQRTLLRKQISLWDYYDGCVKQPVMVQDLVSGIARAIEDDTLNGKIIQAVGPHRYDFYDLIEYIRSCGGQGQKYEGFDVKNMRWDPLMRLVVWFGHNYLKSPILPKERIERDCLTDEVDPKLPTLASLGIELSPIEIYIKQLAFTRPRFLRVDIPYEAAREIDLPKRLDLKSA